MEKRKKIFIVMKIIIKFIPSSYIMQEYFDILDLFNKEVIKRQKIKIGLLNAFLYYIYFDILLIKMCNKSKRHQNL